MSKYSQERIVRIFDKAVGKKAEAPHQIIPPAAGQIALERLKLKTQDVLLDVGTGTGEKAVRAARICRQVIGIDISKKSLEMARKRASREGLNNAIFAYGSFENPCAELDLASYGITKILAVYSLHHLPDSSKKESLKALAKLLHRPGRIVIADIMFFDDPNKCRDQFDAVHYDGGDTDFPSRVEYLTRCLANLGANVSVEKIHSLVGVIVADWA